MNFAPEADAADAISRVSTGIVGLDDVLNGGLPSGHLYLVEGEPGTGKTTIAVQFLLAGLAAGETGLYVTLSESKHELDGMARSHGWSLDGLAIYESSPPEEDLSPEAQYTVFHPSDVELLDTITALIEKVKEVNPQRVVFDSLSELRILARDPLRYRRQILALKRFFSSRQTTVLLLDDRTTQSQDLQLQSIAHGILTLYSLSRDFGVKRRRLEVIKLRGSKYREGFHDFTIQTGGIQVYPRLIAAEHRGGLERISIKSGIQALDDLLGRGIDSGTSTLLMGPAGSGKSTVAARYAVTAAMEGRRSAFFIFDEAIATLIERSRKLGMDVQPHLDSGLMTIEQIDPAELSPGEFVSRARKLVEGGVQILVIDSLNGFMNAMPNEQLLAMQMHEMLNYLGQKGAATIITMTQHGFIGTSMQSPIDISYLADTVLLFRYFEALGEVKQAISVLKKRSGYHERAIRELIFSDGHLSVGPPLMQFRGILSGTPHKVDLPGPGDPE